MIRHLPRALLAATTLALPALALAQDATPAATPPAEEPLASTTLLLFALIPTLIIIASAFLKAAVVLNILRGAFGQANIPPALVITALAFLIAIIVMLPVVDQTLALTRDEAAPTDIASGVDALDRTALPLLEFLERNSDDDARARFQAIAADQTLTSPLGASQTLPRLRAALPAFVTTELTEAFQIGLLLLLPLIVLDLFVAALLQGAGLAAVQPHVIALPLKLLLFVLLDGWTLLIEGLLTGYT